MLVGVAERLGDENPEQILGVEIGRVQRIGIGANAVRRSLGQRALVGDRLDPVDVRLDRGDPAPVDAGRVGVSLVVICDPRVVARGRVRLDDALDQLLFAVLGDIC